MSGVKINKDGTPRKLIAPKKDLAGQRFGRLTVIRISETHRASNGHRLWECICDCGNSKYVKRDGLMCGDYVSCGCYMREKGRVQFITHGEIVGGKESVEYGAWKHT